MRAKLNWAVLPIFSGPLKGDRWLLATRSSFFFGTYEPAQTALFCKVVKPGDVVYDVGAHFGYYTLLASKLVGTEGRVLAFEPSPPNLARLYRHIELNRCSNVQVLELAVSDREGIAHFETRIGSGLGHLAPDGPVEVKVTQAGCATGLPAAERHEDRRRRRRSGSLAGSNFAPGRGQAHHLSLLAWRRSEEDLPGDTGRLRVRLPGHWANGGPRPISEGVLLNQHRAESNRWMAESDIMTLES